MNIDGFILRALTTELHSRLVGQRIDKVHQPNPSTIALHIGKQRLIIDVSSTSSHMLLSTERMQNPLTPPFFCLMLRKHLTNSRIEAVTMDGFERVVMLELYSKDELGNPASLRLMVELTGRHSNVILVNHKGVVVDAIRRVSLASPTTRPVFPGVSYEAPPSQEKVSPPDIDGAKLAYQAQENTADVISFLADNVQGLSQILSREIAYRISISGPAGEVACDKWEHVAQLIRQIAHQACDNTETRGYCVSKGAKVYLHIVELKHLGESISFPGVNETLQFAIKHKDTTQTLEQKRARLTKAAAGSLKKLKRLIEGLGKDLQGTQDKDKDRYYGELLYANIGQHRIEGDMALVTDYYSADLAEVSVPVNPKLALTDNARLYFRRYHKAVGTIDNATRRLEEAINRENYLQSILYNLGQAEDLEVLDQIEQEMTNEGLLAAPKKTADKKGPAPQKTTGPALFVSPDGLRVVVGKNNLQNDLLVRQAKPADIWLHVQKAPGSHCLISVEGPVPESTLLFAANLAAWYSSMRGSSSVPIDYTERRNVKRPSGAKPGFVIYESHKTIVVKEPKEPGDGNGN